MEFVKQIFEAFATCQTPDSLAALAPLRNKNTANPDLSDVELFKALPMKDLWEDAELPSVYFYLRRNKYLVIPSSWEDTIECFDTELDARVSWALYYIILSRTSALIPIITRLLAKHKGELLPGPEGGVQCSTGLTSRWATGLQPVCVRRRRLISAACRKQGRGAFFVVAACIIEQEEYHAHFLGCTHVFCLGQVPVWKFGAQLTRNSPQLARNSPQLARNLNFRVWAVFSRTFLGLHARFLLSSALF